MISAKELISWMDEVGAQEGNKVTHEQVLDRTRPDWPSLGFRTSDVAIEFLQRVREARLGSGYRQGIQYPKRLDGSTGTRLSGSSRVNESTRPPSQFQAASPVQTRQDVVPSPRKFRAIESGDGDNRMSIVGGMFDAAAHSKIRLQAALMELLARADIEEVRKARIGQGLLRRNLIQLHRSCCQVTGIGVRALLRCSHIKPWALCTKREQLDLDNCLLLSAHWDAAFDGGLISFEDDGSLVLGSTLRASPNDAWTLFGGHDRLSSHPSARQAQYLAWHRAEVLR